MIPRNSTKQYTSCLTQGIMHLKQETELEIGALIYHSYKYIVRVCNRGDHTPREQKAKKDTDQIQSN